MPEAINKQLLITNLPDEILEKIMHYSTYDEIATNRIICKRFNDISKGILNRESKLLINHIEKCMNDIKATLPRRASAKEAHPRFSHFQVLDTMHLYVDSLMDTYSSYVENNAGCFIAGKVMDEAITTLKLIKVPDRLIESPYTYNLELREISNMAEEHFNEIIKPHLKNTAVNNIKIDSFFDSTKHLFKKSKLNNSRSSSSTIITTPKPPSQSLRKIQYRIRRNKVAVLCVKGQLGKMRSRLHQQNQKLNELTRRLESVEQKLNNPRQDIKKQDLLDICEKLFPHIKLV